MKRIYGIFSFVLLFFLSCQQNQNLSMQEMFVQNERVLNDDEQKIIEQVREVLLSTQVATRSYGEIPERSLKTEDVKAMVFTKLPHYKLDTSCFSTDLSATNLQKAIQPNALPFYLGKLNGEPALLLTAQQVGEQVWGPESQLEGIEYLKKVFGWLQVELNRSKTKNFYVLEALGMHYMVYDDEKGETMYCNFPGNIRMKRSEWIQHLLFRYNNGKAIKRAFDPKDSEKDSLLEGAAR